MPRQFYDWQDRPKKPPGAPLPVLPGVKNQKEFGSIHGIEKNLPRLYRDARAQYAGYSSYAEWIKAREKTGTKRKPKPKYKTVEFETGKAYIFDFTQENKTGLTIPRSRENKMLMDMNALISALKPGYFLQFFYRANNYTRQNEDINISDWQWSSTALIPSEAFLDFDWKRSDNNILLWFYEFNGVRQYTFPEKFDSNFPVEFSTRMANKTIYGLREVHITIWERPSNNQR